jgi:hypothetical protein
MTDHAKFLSLLAPYANVDSVADNRMVDGKPGWMFNGLITPTLYPIDQPDLTDAPDDVKAAVAAYQRWRAACQDYKAAGRPILTPPQLGEDYDADPMRCSMSDALNDVIASAWSLHA